MGGWFGLGPGDRHRPSRSLPDAIPNFCSQWARRIRNHSSCLARFGRCSLFSRDPPRPCRRLCNRCGEGGVLVCGEGVCGCCIGCWGGNMFSRGSLASGLAIPTVRLAGRDQYAVNLQLHSRPRHELPFSSPYGCSDDLAGLRRRHEPGPSDAAAGPTPTEMESIGGRRTRVGILRPWMTLLVTGRLF